MNDLLPASLPRMYDRLARLVADLAAGAFPAGLFAAAEKLLEALPLATGEMAVIRNRLANARAYAAAGELGAARYELRLLARDRAVVTLAK